MEVLLSIFKLFANLNAFLIIRKIPYAPVSKGNNTIKGLGEYS